MFKWNEIVDSLQNSKRDKLPLKLCFLDGNYLYKHDLVELFEDREFKKVLISKFTLVSRQDYTLSEKKAEKFLYGVQDSPGNSLPTDTEIYSSRLFYINEEGLFSSTAHRDNKKYPVSSKPTKHWDCNLLSIKANSYPQIALSGGNEGLFELDVSGLRFRSKTEDPKPISQQHSSFANYTFWSVYNSSLIDHSYMALFDLEAQEVDPLESMFSRSQKKFVRNYNRNIDEQEIFGKKDGGNFLSWGVDDKIYRATNQGFEIVKFRNRVDKEKEEKHFAPVQSIDLLPWKGRVIGGGVSYFGTIVECENALVVMLSDGTNKTIEGPITRWRVYPRSINYQNHLHVIKDDRIEIYSFNQDYFLTQDEKLVGLEYKEPWIWSNKRRI